jgi:hypothetical protein
MAEYLSTFIYYLAYDDTVEPPVYYVITGFDDEGVSVGGGDDTFSLGDLIDYEDSIGPVQFEYAGFFEGGWVGREECGCGEYDYYLVTNDGTLEPGQELAVVSADFTVCFLAGTAIACPDGERLIEDLAVGDLVVTADGTQRRVRFVGRQTFTTLFADPLRTRPVCIRAGALGEGLPRRDLCLSPDHAILVDGVLVQAGALVDGIAITRMSGLPERFTYFHIELDDHALIFAEGLPAETFVGNVPRRRFDNWADYVALYGEQPRLISEMPLPRVKSARQMPRRARGRAAREVDATGVVAA